MEETSKQLTLAEAQELQVVVGLWLEQRLPFWRRWLIKGLVWGEQVRWGAMVSIVGLLALASYIVVENDLSPYTMILVLIGIAIGILLAIIYWLSNNNRKK